MPGLQSLVSAWVKVNHGHGEYFGDVSSVRDRAAGVASESSSSSVVVSTQQQQQQQQQRTSPSQSVAVASSSLSGPWAMHPPVNGQQQQQSTRLPSSSLSTYALPSAHRIPINSDVSTAVTNVSAPPPTPPWNHEASLPSQSASSSIDPNMVTTMTTSAARFAQHSHITTPSIHHRPRKTGHAPSHPYYNDHNDRAPPHPQAGADAILGRRKNHLAYSLSSSLATHPDSIQNHSVLHDSLSLSLLGGGDGGAYDTHRHRQHAWTATTVATGSRYRTRRRSSERSSEGIMGADDPIMDYIQSHSEYGMYNSLSDFDQIYNAHDNHDNSHNNGNSKTRESLSERQSNQNKFGALLQQRFHDKNSFGTNDSLRRDWNNIQSMQDQNETAATTNNSTPTSPNTENQDDLAFTGRHPHRHSIPMSQITDTSSDMVETTQHLLHPPPHPAPTKNGKSAAIPIPSKNMFARHKIKKSRSRSDLVRQMALDRNHRPNPRANDAGAPGGGDAESVASNASPRRNSSFVSSASGKDDEDVAGRPEAVASEGGVERDDAVLFPTFSGGGAEDGNVLRGGMDSRWRAARATGAEAGFSFRTQRGYSMLTSPSTRKTSFDSQSTVETGNVRSRHINYEAADQFNMDHDSSLRNQGSRPMNATIGATLTSATTNQMGSTTECNRCAPMEATILSLQADIEYLRSLELQREFVCMECESSGSVLKHSTKGKKTSSRHAHSHHPPSIPENPSSAQSESSAVSTNSRGSSRLASSKQLKRASGGSIGGASRSTLRNSLQGGGSRTAAVLREASKRLGDLSTRHKRQVKQSTHERAYWQNEMHLKLEKFAMMAKNLNEEAAKRSNEVKETQAALDKVTSERNALISQVETLKARVALYEEESVDHAVMRKKWEKDELQSLTEMERIRKDQDNIIQDLSLRLDLAMKTIEAERRQQQQRRQIIFPSSRQSSSLSRESTNSPSSPHQPRPSSASPEPTKIDDLEIIKRTSKEMTRKYQLVLESAMAQSAARENEMRTRLEALEQELREVKLMNSSQARGGDDLLDKMDLIEGRLRYKGFASSSASL
ncbi:hypothetical protein ACHAWX_004568 [Stephanocyclus meneghinianus]